MIKIENTADVIKGVSPYYEISFYKNKPFATVKSKKNKELFSLFLGSNINTTNKTDQVDIKSIKLLKNFRIKVELDSSVWESSTIIFKLNKKHFSAKFNVKGKGKITDCKFFGGYYTNEKAGSGIVKSSVKFKKVFNASPSTREKYYLPVESTTHIGVTGSSLPGQQHWFFTPTPLCFSLGNLDKSYNKWLTLGVVPKKGEYNFTRLSYEGSENNFDLKLSYEGHTKVKKEFSFPEFVFIFENSSPYKGMENYVKFFKGSKKNKQEPKWWKKPIFCGWGEQCMQAEKKKSIEAKNLSTQKLYNSFLLTLEENGIVPGTVVIDDKWQKEYGTNYVDREKWPNLEEWIENKKSSGQKVLLWLKAWDSEGLDKSHCICTENGKTITVDPLNQKYIKVLKQSIYRMIKEYDADGFKIDFSARTPCGPNLTKKGNQWGIELLHTLLKTIYTETKKLKEDSLIITHTPNPYFRDVTDMIRLNDINCNQPVVEQMKHRAKVSNIACPDHLVDTDNWPMPNIKEWKKYTNIQKELGIPSLYYVTGINHDNFLKKEDYKMLVDAWDLTEM